MTRTISILATVLIAVSACDSSPRTSPDSPSAMVEVLTGDAGNADLKS